MGLLSSLASKFGLQRPLEVRELGPVQLTEGARAHLSQLPAGQAVHLSTVPGGGGWVVQVEPGPCMGPPPPGFEGLPLTAGDADLARLRGLQLDLRDGRWVVALSMELRARETPNPDGRQYLADRVLATGPAAVFLPGGSRRAPLADRLLAIEGVHSVLFRDHTVTVEREPGVAWEALDRLVDGAVREHFLLCGPLVESAQQATGDDPLFEEVAKVLREQVAPAIQKDGGDISLIEVKDGVVRVELVGACRTCPASALTLKGGVERTLRQVLGDRIVAVEAI